MGNGAIDLRGRWLADASMSTAGGWARGPWAAPCFADTKYIRQFCLTALLGVAILSIQ